MRQLNLLQIAIITNCVNFIATGIQSYDIITNLLQQT